MNQTFKKLINKRVIKSLRIWHIAPLSLPLLLGSASLVPGSVPAAKSVVSPLLSSALPNPLASPVPSQSPLASQTVKSLTQNPSAPPQTQRTARTGPLQGTTPQTNAQTTNTQTAAPQNNPASASNRNSLAQASIARSAAPQPAQNQPPIPLRVAVAIDAPSLTIATSEPGVVMDQSGRSLGQLTAQEAVAVSPSGGGLQVGSTPLPSIVWIKPITAQGLVHVEGKWYRGPVQLVARSEGLLAVNHTDLETYLYSVVGAEMPASWPLEALKAQAIAARSYAVVHIARPASDFFDLGSTTRWQAYSGIETETNTTQMAVNATRGMLLSYQGGVVESLYASSEQLVKEAHSGFGMSQEGANELAQQNFNYQQILGRFYPGTNLAVLNIQ